MDREKKKEVIDEIRKRTGKNAYSLVIEAGKTPGLTDSKFGGVPYWDMSKEYPVNRDGEKLMLLAQINFDRMFEDMEADEILPRTGMLQFFIGADDVFGMAFDEPDKQDTFRVVYHETIDDQVTAEQVLRLEVPVSTSAEMEEYSPVWKEAALDIHKTEIFMGDGDYRFDRLFRDIAREKFEEDLGEKPLYGVYKMMEEYSNEGHWLLGYPYFTQGDPREYEEKYQYYDTLLFQMDSDSVGNEDYVLWGDCGVANFFINHEDLKNRDFSKVLYNWDCC